MSQLVVYSSNTCPQCRGAKMFLNNKGINFEERNVDIDESFKDEMRDMGLSGLPLIVASSTTIPPFVGFNTTKLKQVVDELNQLAGV